MPLPPFAISSGSLFTSPIRDQIEACRAAAVGGLGIWEEKLGFLEDDEHTARLLVESGIKATFCFPSAPGVLHGDTLFAQPKDRATRLELLKSGIKRLSRFRPVAVICLAGAPRDIEPSTARGWVVPALREAAATARAFGVPLAMEVIKPGPSGSLVSTIPEALELLSDVGDESIGLLIDTWHFWEDPNALEDIREYADRIIGVQVNDYPQQCRGWCDRALPGQGIMPLKEIFRCLVDVGYQGWYELEVFSDDGTFGNAYPDSLWAKEPIALVREGCQAFEIVWNEAMDENNELG